MISLPWCQSLLGSIKQDLDFLQFEDEGVKLYSEFLRYLFWFASVYSLEYPEGFGDLLLTEIKYEKPFIESRKY